MLSDLKKKKPVIIVNISPSAPSSYNVSPISRGRRAEGVPRGLGEKGEDNDNFRNKKNIPENPTLR